MLSAVALLAALLGSPWPVELAAPSPPAEPIFGGEAVAPGAWPAVVGIYIDGYLCTGTLVSPTVVVTAAHCLLRGAPVERVIVRRGEDLLFPGPSIPVAAYLGDPAYCSAESCREDVRDYGYIELAVPQTDIAEFPRLIGTQREWDQLMRVDRLVTVVGYGLDENGNQDIKRQVEVPIVRFSASGLEFQAGGMGLDSCNGDSGGPVFARLDSGEWRLVGITSRGAECGDGGYYGTSHGGMCWLFDNAGLDLRPPNCEQCDCIDTDPAREEGCDCDASGGAAASGAPLLLVLLARRRGRQRPDKKRRR